MSRLLCCFALAALACACSGSTDATSVGASSPLTSDGQHCVTAGTVNTNGAPLWGAPPDFVFGVGWQGDLISTLDGSTPLYVCREQTTELGLSTKTWFQVAVDATLLGNSEGWAYGWTSAEDVTVVTE